MISVQSYKGLSTLLYALAVLEALAGLILIFGSHWILSMAPASLALPDTAFLTIFMRRSVLLPLVWAICFAWRLAIPLGTSPSSIRWSSF